MIKYYSADYVLPVAGPPLKKGTVAVDTSGEIIDVYSESASDKADLKVEKFEGIIVPGFVNTHCHLELSHLKDSIPKNLGLIPFLKEVIKSRNDNPPDNIEGFIKEADNTMFQNGIVAVADVSNTTLSKQVKLLSNIHYHTFIELICFEPEKAKEVFRAGGELMEEFKPLKSSLVPHAAYSVCKELFRFISKFCGESGELLSIHNQETEEENKFYRYKTGQFVDFYKEISINTDFFKPQARNSLQSFIPMLAEKQKVLLVHNIYTSMKDVYFIRRSGREISWCFCPNANLYIEGRLPKLETFLFNDFNITLGTDSLASNGSLCILSELKTLHTHFPILNLEETIAWATLNGAKFLGIDRTFGSIERGKKPGLNLISNVSGLSLTQDSKVKKLI